MCRELGVAALWRWERFVLAAGFVFSAASFCAADEPIQVVKIIEHWELTLNAPDASTTAPQITLTVSPTANLTSHYATLELNHQASPVFAAGGVHFHVWKGDHCLGSRHQAAGEPLNTAAEVIRWKQELQLADSQLTFSIVDGTSTTWGEFGGDSMRIVVPTTLTDLNAYRPSFSVTQSGVGYAGGRVKRLAIVKLTAFTSTGQSAESDKLRIAHETK
jgi:hypothetical protein